MEGLSVEEREGKRKKFWKEWKVRGKVGRPLNFQWKSERGKEGRNSGKNIVRIKIEERWTDGRIISGRERVEEKEILERM